MIIDTIGKTNGPYFDRLFSDLELEYKTLTAIPENLRKGEAQLFGTKNEAYRSLHPMAATMLFAGAYETAYRWAMRKREDFRSLQKLKVFSAQNPIDDTEQNRLGLWAARRAADRLGVDYEKFCHYALDYSERAGWKRLALPRELASESVIEAVLSRLTSETYFGH